MSAVHILQGLPGAGKTTFIRRQFGSTPIVICSADHFLVDPDGVYRVSRQGLANAHGRCLQKYVGALQGGAPEPIVVDNTNLTVAEIAPYVALAQAYGAPVRIWHLDAAPADCRSRQTHPIPPDVFLEMQRSLAAFAPPPWWPERSAISLASAISGTRVYLGLSIEPIENLRHAREAVCAELDLLPRTEFHITLVFLGDVTAPQCEALADALVPHVDEALGDIRFEGTGVAYQPAGGPAVLVRADETTNARAHARVAWWSVHPSQALCRLQTAAKDAAKEFGLGAFESQPFHPHVTLGSRGGDGVADQDFDLYTIRKEPSLRNRFCPRSTRATRLHVTSSKVLPASLACIRAW